MYDKEGESIIPDEEHGSWDRKWKDWVLDVWEKERYFSVERDWGEMGQKLRGSYL